MYSRKLFSQVTKTSKLHNMEIEIIYKSMPSCGIDSPLQTTTFDTAAAVFADRCVESGRSMYNEGC